MIWTEKERRRGFESIVLSALWLIITMIFYWRKSQGGAGSGMTFGAEHVRGNMLLYMDQVGLQHEGAKKYRRSDTFPELRRES